ncbi:hypothetical protein ACFL01_05110, partial [Planctomycetota bacterium]
RPAGTDGAVLFREDFESGRDRWRGVIANTDIKTDDHVSLVELDSPHGNTKALRMDGAKLRNKTIGIISNVPFKKKAIAVEFDARIEDIYEDKNNLLWTVALTMPNEGTSQRDVARYPSGNAIELGSWCHYRREFYTRKEGASYIIDMKSFTNGERTSHVQIKTDSLVENHYQPWIGCRNVRVAYDNVIVREIEMK